MRRRWISSLVIVLILSPTACATWRPVRRDQIARTLDERQPTRLRVAAAGAIVEMKRPAVVRDTLVGRQAALPGRLRLAIPLSEIDSLAMLQSGRPPALVAAPIVGVMGLAIVLAVFGYFHKPAVLSW